jgi:hypothetical protein
MVNLVTIHVVLKFSFIMCKVLRMNKVQIAYVHQNLVSHSFHHSMMRLTKRQEDSPNPSYEIMPLNIAARGTTMGLPEARNEIMRIFLDETDATHLFTVDTDMGFPSDTIDLLINTHLPVVGALCYGQSEVSPDDLGGYTTKPFAVAYDMVHNQNDGLIHFTLKEDLDIDAKSPQHVAATGTGCLLISRNAAERVRDAYGDAWFDQVAYKGTKPVLRISEDLSFCYRLSTCGIPIHVHTGVRTNHLKNVWLS